MVLWWLQGLAEDHKDGCCGHSVRHRLQMCCNGCKGRLRTKRVRYRGWIGTVKMAFVLLSLVGL